MVLCKISCVAFATLFRNAPGSFEATNLTKSSRPSISAAGFASRPRPFPSQCLRHLGCQCLRETLLTRASAVLDASSDRPHFRHLLANSLGMLLCLCDSLQIRFNRTSTNEPPNFHPCAHFSFLRSHITPSSFITTTTAMSDSENQNQSHDDDDHDGDYTIGDDGSNYSVIQRMQHWMGKFGIGVITDAIRSAVEVSE